MQITFLLLLISFQALTEQSPLLFPLPKNLTYGTTTFSLPSISFTFHFNSELIQNPGLYSQVQELLQKYYRIIYQPQKIKRYYKNQDYDFSYRNLDTNQFIKDNKENATFDVNIKNCSIDYLQYNISEAYTLDFSQSSFLITADTYFGFPRALQTLSQLLDCSTKLFQSTSCIIPYLPLHLTDSPDFQHRGVMLDPSRHFLPLPILLRAIDSLSYAKMNILHLHFTDSNSFSTWVIDYPEITKFGAFYYSEYYTIDDLKILIQHGNLMAVRIIPEYDSPGHTRAWGLSPNLLPMIACQGIHWSGHAAQPPCGQLDPLLNQTYDIIESIAKQTNDIFMDQVFHWGGDEVNQGCWDAKETIKQAIQESGVQSIEQSFVQKQRSILKNINETKKAMYWAQGPAWKNKGDILQHWGGTSSVDGYQQFADQYLVISSVDSLYMDCGLGNLFGSESWCGTYKDFRTIFHTNFQINKEKQYIVLGGEACMWGELVNAGSVENKLWGRVSALAEKLWNHQYYSEDLSRLNQMQKIIPRLAKFEQMLMKRGISVTPVTTDFCSQNVKICFSE